MPPLEANTASHTESGTIIPSHTIITHIPVCLRFLFVCCRRVAPLLIKTEGIITCHRCIKELGDFQDPIQTSTAGFVHLLPLACEYDQKSFFMAFGAEIKVDFGARMAGYLIKPEYLSILHSVFRGVENTDVIDGT